MRPAPKLVANDDEAQFLIETVAGGVWFLLHDFDGCCFRQTFTDRGFLFIFCRTHFMDFMDLLHQIYAFSFSAYELNLSLSCYNVCHDGCEFGK